MRWLERHACLLAVAVLIVTTGRFFRHETEA
jgi:hypothetical protein